MIKNLVIYMQFIITFLLVIACQVNKPMFSTGISQGITGTVLWYEGDLMPGINKEPVEGQPVQREIYIYEATSLNQAKVRDDVFYEDLKSTFIKKVSTDEDGRFIVELEPGTYSVFVKELGGLFANTFDESGRINPVTVGSNELVRMRIRIDYKAAY